MLGVAFAPDPRLFEMEVQCNPLQNQVLGQSNLQNQDTGVCKIQSLCLTIDRSQDFKTKSSNNAPDGYDILSCRGTAVPVFWTSPTTRFKPWKRGALDQSWWWTGLGTVVKFGSSACKRRAKVRMLRRSLSSQSTLKSQ